MLVVENEEYLADFWASNSKMFSWTPIVCRTPEEAMRIIDSKDGLFQVGLYDIQLSNEMNGGGLAEVTLRHKPLTVLVGISNQWDRHSVAKALKHFSDVFLKSDPIDKIVRGIDCAVSRASRWRRF